MKLVISPRQAILSPPTYTLGLDNFNILIRVNGDIIHNDDPQNGNVYTGICYDGKGQAINYDFTPSGASGEDLTCTFEFNNPYDYLDLELVISNASYISYSKVIRIYGIDLSLPIVMLDNTDNGTFNINTFFTVYRPLFNLALIYRTTNAIYTSIEYFTNSGSVLSTNADFNVSLTESLNIKCTTVVSSISYTDPTYTIITKYNWMPVLGISMDCSLPCDECFNKLSDNLISAYIDNSNITSVYIDGVLYEYGIFDWIAIKYGLIDVQNNSYYDYSVSLVNPALVNYIQQSSNFQIDDTGDFKAYYEFEVIGDFIVVDNSNITAGNYYVINDSGDISNLNITGTFDPFEIINIGIDGTPLVDNGLKLVAIYDSTNYTDADIGYYYVLDSSDVEVNGVTLSDEDRFYLNEDDVLVITNTGIILPIKSVYSCLSSLNVKGCEPYDIKQIGCNQFDVVNRSLNTQSFSVYQLDSSADDDWELKASNLSVDSGESYTLTFSNDGIYKVVFDDINLIIVSTCELETCKLAYLKKLTCCNDSDKCTDKDDVRFNSREFYNYNAFLLIVHSLYQIIDMQYIFFDALVTINDDKLKIYFEINDLLIKAKGYCNECETCD